MHSDAGTPEGPALAARDPGPSAAPPQALAVNAEVAPPWPTIPGAPDTAPIAPASKDIAALVDRLVEARNAAAPSRIEASVAHADFGRVSLHFRHDEGALSVAMASADPGFAPAVQAAAGSMLAGNSDTPPRHDAPAREQAAASSSQQQSQSQSQAQTRGEARDTGQRQRSAGENPADRHRDAHSQAHRDERRGGIYA